MYDHPDKDMIMSAKEGSHEAFAALYHRYKERILNYLYGYIGNFATAQELAQEVFISAYKNIGTFRFECKFSTWLYTIATNLAKNFIIKNKKNPVELLDSPVDSAEDITLGDMISDTRPRPDEEMEKEILREDIQRSIDALPEKYKEVLLLSDAEGLSYEEIAAVLKCNVGTVGSRLNEARKKFREVFRSKRGRENNEL